jgi:hypothetical protein
MYLFCLLNNSRFCRYRQLGKINVIYLDGEIWCDIGYHEDFVCKEESIEVLSALVDQH